jgi:predicted nucleotidyltransferase
MPSSSSLYRAVIGGPATPFIGSLKERLADPNMKPSISLEQRRDQVCEVLQRFRMRNPRIFGSVTRGQDTEQSDLDILVDAPPGTSLYDLAGVEIELEAILGCKVEVLTKGFLAPDVAEWADADLVPIP